MIFFCVWFIGFVVTGLWLIVKTSGKQIGVLSTDSWGHLIAVLFISAFWFFFLPRWVGIRVMRGVK
jgi:hypothetical protein